MRDIVRTYIVKQHQKPSWLYIWAVSLYLCFLKRRKEQTMFNNKEKQNTEKRIDNVSMTQAKMGTACAIAIIGNIMLHVGFAIAGFAMIGTGLVLVLMYVYKNALSSNRLIPGVVYASR